MSDTTTIRRKAERLINFALGEPWGDGYTVTDIGVGIAEPGYSDIAEAVWVTGNWNPKRWVRDGDDPLTKEESLPVRLGDALSNVGAELLWLDEWEPCRECYRAVRTQPDSYGWTAYFTITMDGLLCGDCATMDEILDDGMGNSIINNPKQCLPTFITPDHLEEDGWTKFNGTYENGWHPGQDDDPVALKEMANEAGWLDVVFRLQGVGQFDMAFEMWVRDREVEDE